ncbi:MAG: DUF4352 domain-containing protein [Propionibacteriaceae bacterium]|nr:DUF4352 domain-containing protein [Propionibacteriaceae bacterium]
MNESPQTDGAPPDTGDGVASRPGMGPTPSGPAFAPWVDAGRAPADGSEASGPRQPLPYPDLATFTPPTSRLPAVVTAVVVLVVSTVVLAATMMAHRGDSQVSQLAPVTTPIRSVVPLREDSIEFASTDGSGRLVVLDHSWMSAGAQRPVSGSYLQVQVELICTSGSIAYDPYFFQAFDATGRLFDVTSHGATQRVLSSGTLGPDERVTGFLTFDMPRGEVTLLMSDDAAESVTALKISD